MSHSKRLENKICIRVFKYHRNDICRKLTQTETRQNKGKRLFETENQPYKSGKCQLQ